MFHFFKNSLIKLLYVSCLFILLVGQSWAQNINYNKNYYPIINKAELAITEEEISVALDYYLEAFEQVPTLFAKDIYNAALCAILLKDEKNSFSLCEKLIVKGTDITFLLAQKAFRDLENSPRWELFIQNYSGLRKRFLTNVNMPLRKEIELMWARDQHFRIKPNGILIYNDTIQAIDKENIDKLKNIIDEYGFPGEALIGVENPLIAPPYHSIIYHHCQKTGISGSLGLADLPNVLIDAVKFGKLSPHRYASYADIQGKPIYANTTFYRIGKEGELRYLKMPESKIRKTNKKRTAIGLEPIGDYRKKVLFSLKNKNFIFGFNDSIIALKGLDQKSIQKFLENSNPVE